MRIRTIATSITAALMLAGLTACGSDNSSDAKPSPAPTTASAEPSVDTSSINASLGIPPAPTGAKRAAYLAAIKAVDPALVQKPDRAIDNGRNQCQALDNGTSGTDHAAAERFGTDTHPITDTQGKALNAVLRLTLCPKG
ncbi:hypothetical protein [Streptomyces sp. DW26H14]|uniref:hypothetical protein n=1 Tax=Streptomyces sp. DW26H14 TaxID=3435395 RepID=UPI00403E27EB